ncbi:MAG: phosphoribosylformylglycinamidine synthase subunit PurS [Brevinematales bacterium]|nr:phosphoribosylformylglycinamidine synthase subunit PurS [Brevinematales bacterium]
MKYKVIVSLKDNVFDPQGSAILKVLHNLGYKDVENVRVGKVFFVETNSNENVIEKISSEVFTNPVIEKFSIEKVEE